HEPPLDDHVRRLLERFGERSLICDREAHFRILDVENVEAEFERPRIPHDGSVSHPTADLQAVVAVARVLGHLRQKLRWRMVVDRRIADTGPHEISDETGYGGAAEKEFPLLLHSFLRERRGTIEPGIYHGRSVRKSAWRIPAGAPI